MKMTFVEMPIFRKIFNKIKFHTKIETLIENIWYERNISTNILLIYLLLGTLYQFSCVKSINL